MGILDGFFGGKTGGEVRKEQPPILKRTKRKKARVEYFVEKAPDVQTRVEELIEVLEHGHINQFRIICMRSRGATARAYARIWNMPKIWQEALDISAFYAIEVLSENFDKLPEEEKTKVLIHELMHIPKTFSGALLPHNHRGGHIGEHEVGKIYREYLRKRGGKEKI